MNKALLKPYDFQVSRRPEEMEDEFYLGENRMSTVNMLIGHSENRKDRWIMRCTKEQDIVIRSPFNNGNGDADSWYTQQIQKRKLIKEVKLTVKNRASGPAIVLTGNDFLTAKDRVYLLDLFPNHKKCAIVWEEELEEMELMGYERPTVDEGFSDFTYYVS